MNRREFLGISGVTIAVASSGTYLLSDKTNFLRSDFADDSIAKFSFQPSERDIVPGFPWHQADIIRNRGSFIILSHIHWIIGNDQESKWLPAVDSSSKGNSVVYRSICSEP